ncbi:hypothetical protein BJV82DRAFT_518078 [Fennellomyces sp. T-0311]|nr:hypothetical protein BJV82DRAFT_518078 [Fennellomyces sp. T-0311]
MPPRRSTKRSAEAKEEKEPPEKKFKATEEESATKKSTDEKPTVLEKGHVYFLYRPKMDVDEVTSADDVQKAYMVLKPSWSSCDAKRKQTLIVLGRKKLPETKRHSRYWGFVAEASDDLDDLTAAFQKHSYETKTKGERTVQPSRPMGEGVYEIATHNGHSHLAYMLTLPEELHQVQKAFNIEEQASIVISVKNPTKSSPSYAGLSSNQKADFPEKLQEAFADRRFVSMDTTEFLNYNNCELMLIGATEKVKEELGNAGKELEKMEEKDEDFVEHVGVDKSVFDALELEKKENPVEPLEGKWA